MHEVEDARGLIAIRSLRFGYRDARVIDVDAYDVQPHRITAFIGPNGCGKTTLFKLMNGLLEPSAGDVLLDGHSLSSPPGRALLRERTVYVHQNPYIFRDTVDGNIAYGLRVRRVPREQWQRRIEASLHATGIAELAGRNARELSGGERQRLAIARALALEPMVLLLDEPTSNVDPSSVRIIENAIGGARDAGMTVLLNTHSLATAYRIADEVASIEGGTLLADQNNVYRGVYDAADETTGRFQLTGGTLVTSALDGTFAAAVVPMEDVILSSGVLHSSAQNQFPGVVTAVASFRHGVRVDIDCGFSLSALVTERAIDQLQIRIGSELSASFKASAVRLY